MLSVELGYLAELLDEVGVQQDVSGDAREWSTRIKDAIWEHTVSSLVGRFTCQCAEWLM